tara:strand:- start:2599 stop:4200 length:1602 start_codon:yes stop_codon:yes gene_type:complete
MNKVYFIADFFSDEVAGGAELVDSVLCKHLTTRGLEVIKLRSFESDRIKISLSDKSYYIISNFTGMSDEIKDILKNSNYCIFEHDHKYLTTRDPSVFPNYQAPAHAIINRDFYANAKTVFCQSKKHKEVVESNLKLNNIVNLGCSLWSEEELSSLQDALSVQKTNKVAVLQSHNEIKGQKESVEYCKNNNIEFDFLPGMPYGEFVSKLSEYDKLVFFPKVLESFSRLAVEARVLNCSLITNNLLGCASEEWFRQKKGKELLSFLRLKKKEILEKIFVQVSPKKQFDKEGITVILNSYRRPYNLEMQIKAIREQTVKPAQIWLWVNAHEDNEGFDYSTLDIDRIFNNDYNWKFYGRFAAALLADTEHVAIFDDDTVPGSQWFENCIETMSTQPGILGSAGVILKDKFYVQHDRCGWPTQNSEVTRVDLVGHAWFFKREWLQYLWREKPTTWDNGEDIQFSYLAQKYGNIQTFCPPHPPNNRNMHGSILGNELGIDSKATSTNNAVSHNQFFSERDLCVQTAIKGGWRTVKEVKS